MIPNIGELAVMQSKFDYNQSRKNEWKSRRFDAMEYYKGDTNQFTSKYFSESTLNKIVAGNVNVTKRVIDRISLVYMTPPKRIYTNEQAPEYFVDKDFKLQRLERLTNLLDSVLLKPCWRVKDDGTGCIEYDIIWDYEMIFDDADPLRPTAVIYPIAKKSTVLDTTPEMYAYWDAENHMVFDKSGKMYTEDDNPDMINPYGKMPFVECFREGRPEFDYLDTNPSLDLIATNLAINVAETNKNANVMFQSFGYLFVNGTAIDPADMNVGQDKINFLGVDGSISIVSPPNAIPALDESIKSSYKLLSQNYHLPTSFVDGTTAESGVALRLRNQELQDDRKSDVTRWRDIEYKLFELETLIVAVEQGKDLGDLEDIDYHESVDILSDQEQREKWDWELSKGIIDVADILMQKNPDLTREEAEEILGEKTTQFGEEEAPQNTLLEALAKPTE
tara:strand:- start:745 stop:2088 length:1344 start_codon:yes stop_codon:yes gene_type:complete